MGKEEKGHSEECKPTEREKLIQRGQNEVSRKAQYLTVENSWQTI